MNKSQIRLSVVSAFLLGATTFLGCSSDKDTVEDNPTYNPVTNTVNVDFVFNVAGGASAKTRMSAANTQATSSETFRGMQDVKVISFQQEEDGQIVTESTKSAETTTAKVFDLGQILVKGQIGNTSNGEELSHRVVELPMPVNTNSVMFYGRAFKDGNAKDQGVINGVDGDPTSGTYTQTDKLDQTFKLTKRLESTKLDRFKAVEQVIAGVCTRIVQNGLHVEGLGDGSTDSNRDLRATFWWPEPWENTPSDDATTILKVPETGNYYSYSTLMQHIAECVTNGTLPAGGRLEFESGEGNTYTYYYKIEKEWSEYGETYDDENERSTMAPLEEILGDAFSKLVKSGADNSGEEVRAGSGDAVLRTITDLWYVVDKVATATPTNYAEKLAKLVAERIETRLSTYFKLKEGENGNDGKDGHISATDEIEWESSTKAQYEAFSGETISQDITGADLNDFPQNLELPMGAAQILVKSSDKNGKKLYSFEYDSSQLNLGGIGNGIDINTLMYPSELMYYGNSPIRVSAEAKTTADYPETVANWDNNSNWAGWESDSHVKSSTRSVAVIHDINYGNALLETTVKISSDKLQDNRNHFFPSEENAEISKSFRLTGVLVGGQPEGVDWLYLPMTDTDTGFSYIVYDREIPNGSIPADGSYSQPNYTMVLDNYNSSKDENTQNTVYVALEFVNNSGTDFWGDHNVVRRGGTFYLVGKLNPQDIKKTEGETTTGTAVGPTWPEMTDKFRSTPPYNEDGTTKKINRVFIQDFMTKAQFTIGPKSLQSAFVTVPDLRSAEISLGLSVDVKWENGMNFEVVLGDTSSSSDSGNSGNSGNSGH